MVNNRSSIVENHTPGPWHFDKDNAGLMSDHGYGLLYGDMDVYGGSKDLYVSVGCSGNVERHLGKGVAEANARLIAAAPDMARAVRASHAWAYCEHHGLGDWSARSTLCAHAEYLNAKALAKMEGRDFDQEYKGSRRMIVWPHVSLEESDEAEAEGLVTAALEHEQKALKASDLMAIHDETMDALRRA
jgi:selenocysteine lyase/cysteine desulfurase